MESRSKFTVGVSSDQIQTSSKQDKTMSQRRRSSSRRRQWAGLMSRWSMLGVFEIDEKHEFYDVTCMMKSGLSHAIQTSSNESTPNDLSPDDFTKEETDIHEGFLMQTFAGPAFANLRHSVNISEEEYETSLTSSEPYLQFISNSKSKADFFITHDRRFFLKTQTKRETDFLLSTLKIYIEHLHKYPHSLLVKILGLHRIISGETKKYFIVMQSVFYPDERITARYDIKGCEVGRWSNPTPQNVQPIAVLKDMNFEGQHITVGEQRSWLIRQVQIDTAFLNSMNVLDYSLLLAHQPLHKDELNQKHHLASLVLRTTKSLDQNHPTHATERDSHTSDNSYETSERSEDEIHLQYLHGHHQSQDPQQVQAQNRRLLPDFRNPLHVIDGPQLRYFVGIIDIFTEYGLKKKLENLWKRIKYPRRAFSTVSPSAYSLRFIQWVENHTK